MIQWYLNFRKKLQMVDSITNLIAEKKSLEIDKKNVQFELELATKRQGMKAEAEEHKYMLEMEKVKKQYEIKQDEIMSLLKLDSEQKLKQQELAHKEATNALETKFAKELTEQESKLQKDFYTRMQDALGELHSKGNVTTQFMQDIALKLMEGGSKFNKNRTSLHLKQSLPKGKNE